MRLILSSKTPLFILTPLFLIASCTSAHLETTDSDDSPIITGEETELFFDQTREITGTPYALTFTKIMNDSRCPTDVECYWPGMITIQLTLLSSENPAENFEMDFTPYSAPEQIDTQNLAENLILSLLDVTPYLDSKLSYEDTDYSVTLRVDEK